MDNELFELCKEVYRRLPNWHNDESGFCVWNDSIAEVNKQNTVWAREDKYIGYAPLYTSDYLLEKLPRDLIRYGRFELTPTMANTRWSAGYWTLDRLDTRSAVSDTPLKALLKLVIALDDAGVKIDGQTN